MRRVRDVERKALESYQAIFGRDPVVLASAPGRVNLIGDHTDYNGGFVLPCAIDRRVAVAISEGAGELYSADFGESLPAEGQRDGSWADYPRGVAWALRDAGYDVPWFSGAIAGDVPHGSGLSSSAAIEVATAMALDALGALSIERRDLALLCQCAENAYVGVNSGIMDQYASLLCREGSALLLDCRSLDAELVPVPLEAAGLALVVCDTRVERGLSATGYNDRRAACERAAAALGVSELRDATENDLQRLNGEELRRARHVVSENERVLAAAKALRAGDYPAFGRAMFASHTSLRDDYEVSTGELDVFVEVARANGALGARLTGAGFGGCAIALIAAGSVETLEATCRERFAQSGYKEPKFYDVHPSEGAQIVS